MELRSFKENKNISHGKKLFQMIYKKHRAKGGKGFPDPAKYLGGEDLDLVLAYLPHAQKQHGEHYKNKNESESVNENIHVWNGKNLDKGEVINAAMAALYTLNPNERENLDAQEIARRLDCGIPIGFENNRSALNEYEGRLILMREV